MSYSIFMARASMRKRHFDDDIVYFILAKNAKKYLENHLLKPPTFALIMLSSIQPVKIPEKITFFVLIILVKVHFFPSDGQKCQKWGFNSIKNIFTHQYFSVLSASINKYDQ